MEPNGTRWQDTFNRGGHESGRDIGGISLTSRGEPPDKDGPPDLDLAEYKPWILQRGQSRPSMMIDFRHFEPRSGLWSGWALSYPHLIGLHYTGKQMLSLDFGTRHIVIQGDGLDELARHIQQGIVVSIQEWTPKVWPQKPPAGIVIAIRHSGMDQHQADRGSAV